MGDVPKAERRTGARARVMQLTVRVRASLVLIPRYGAWGAASTSVLVTLTAAVYLKCFAWPNLAGANPPDCEPAVSME